jgi:hypothetical protein
MKGIKNLNSLFHRSKLHLKRASPTILTYVAAIGVVATSVMAVKATPKAMMLLEQATDEKGEELTKLEVVRVAGPVYIPALAIGVSTISCIFGANVLNKRNQASLISAYAMLSESYQQYRRAANVVYGEDADARIKAEMAKDTYVSGVGMFNNVSVYSPDMDPESEKILCYDLFSQRYFTSTMAAVLNAEYHINRNLQVRGEVSLNELYDFMGLAQVENGDEIGWSLDQLYEDEVMWLDFTNTLTNMDDGMVCCIISATHDPQQI